MTTITDQWRSITWKARNLSGTIQTDYRLGRNKWRKRRARNSRKLVRFGAISLRPRQIDLIVPNYSKHGQTGALIALRSGVKLFLPDTERAASDLVNWWDEVCPARWRQ